MNHLLLLFLGTLVSLGTAVKYEIVVTTGTASYAGTDANVRITLYGDRGSTPAILLASDDDDFEQGAVQKFIVDTYNVGKVNKIKVQHDNSGWGAGWYLNKVEVRYYDGPKTYTVFDCNTWISSNSGLIKSFFAKSRCGLTTLPTSRIVGGNTAQAGAWPWQVSIDYNYDFGGGNRVWQGHWCGGSIISEQWIISAAHCFSSDPYKSYYKVTVGEHDLRRKEGYEQIIPIEKLILHSGYDKNTHDNDIALIKLKYPIKYSNRALPVCLPTSDLPAKTECFITGWGALNEGASGPAVLHQAKVPLVNHDTCNRMYYSNFDMRITSRMRCAGYTSGGIDSCQGDSGGPLVCKVNGRWHLMGAVSWGVGCGRVGVYGVYADIVSLKDWLLNTM